MDAAIAAGLAAVPFFMKDYLGAGPKMLGAVGAMQSASYAAMSLISSKYVSRAKNGLVWAVVGIACFAVLFNTAPFMRHPYAFAAFSTAGFAGVGLVWPAMWAWLGGERNARLRARRMSHYNMAWSVGLTLGPFFGGFLYDVHHWLPFACVFSAAAVALVIEATLPHEKDHFRRPENAADGDDDS